MTDLELLAHKKLYQKKYLSSEKGQLNQKRCRERWRAKPENRLKEKKKRDKYRASLRGQIKQREHHLKRYGITLEEYDKLLTAQEYKCAICDMFLKNIIVHLDHNHQTGEIRGLLCQKCNFGLGNFQDNSSLLQKAIKYLDNKTFSMLRSSPT